MLSQDYRGEPKWQSLNGTGLFRVAPFPSWHLLWQTVFSPPPSPPTQQILEANGGIIQGWLLKVFDLHSAKNMAVVLSAARVWSDLFIRFGARDADLRSEQPSGRLTIFSIWFQAQLSSIWPKLLLVNTNLHVEHQPPPMSTTKSARA